MCLYTKQTESKIAEEDITCYKFYIRCDKMLISPYQGFIAPKIGIVANTELEKPYKPGEFKLFYRDFYGFKRVDNGFHSFKVLEEVKSVVNEQKNRFDLVIFKCIIPKGSLYYSGKFLDYESYCSNSIKLVEVCV